MMDIQGSRRACAHTAIHSLSLTDSLLLTLSLTLESKRLQSHSLTLAHIHSRSPTLTHISCTLASLQVAHKKATSKQKKFLNSVRAQLQSARDRVWHLKSMLHDMRQPPRVDTTHTINALLLDKMAAYCAIAHRQGTARYRARSNHEVTLQVLLLDN